MSDAPQPQTEPVVPAFHYPDAATIGIALIKRFEDCCLSPLPDTGPVGWQIGYGCNYTPDGHPVTAHTPPIDRSTAELWLLQRLGGTYANQTDAMLGDVTVTSGQRGALYSFGWNSGEGNLLHSTMLRLILVGKKQEAADEFPKWVYSAGKRLNGLVLRRAVERAVFLGDVPLEQIPTWKPPVAGESGGSV